MSDWSESLKLLESEIERRLVERFAALRDEFDRLRIESDRRWEGFLPRFDQDFRGIVPPELLPQRAEGEPGRPQPPTRGSLPIDAVRALDEAANQVEVLHRFLDLCRRHASRAVLLIARGSDLGVWKAVGFSDHGGIDEEVRRITISAQQTDPLPRVLEGAPCRLSPGNEISRRLGAHEPAGAVVVPMAVKEKVSGALYADVVAGEEDRFDPEAIAFLTHLAGVTVDRLAGRKLKPAPALRPPQASVAEPAAERELALEYEPGLEEEPPWEPDARIPRKRSRIDVDEFAPPPAPAPSARRKEVGEATSPPARGLERALPPEEIVSARPPSAATMRIETVREPSVPPALASEPSVEGPSVSTGARRLAGPLAAAEGEERRDEARRFAKLLVSEIKLYNERAVQEGREHGNLYERLKEDIDRSRQMYDERIPQDIRASSNFFYEELVRVLAGGRADVLGI